MNKGVDYRGVLLMPGSECFELYHSKDDPGHKKLDKLLKELEQKNKDLIQRYEKGD